MDSRIDKEINFQNNRVTSDDEAVRKYQHLISEEHEYLNSLLEDVKDKKILTMGCSTGGVTPFARKGAWVLGIDISNEALKKLNRSIKKEHLEDSGFVLLSDCEHLSVKKKSFDIILFFGVLHHLDIEKTMAQCHEVLKDDGKIIMAEPLGLHPVIWIYRKLTPGLRTEFEHPLVPSDFKTIDSLFKITDFKAFCLTSVFSLAGLILFRSDYLYKKLKNLFNGFDSFLFKIMPFLKYYAWAAVITLKKK